MNNKKNYKSTEKNIGLELNNHQSTITRRGRIRDEDAHNMVPKKCICIRLLTCSVADVRRVRFPVALSSIRLHFFEAPKLVGLHNPHSTLARNKNL